MQPGSELTLDIERPAVGGRMLARHDGQVVLVWGAIPGERVRARVERVGSNVLFAETTAVLSPSEDRRDAGTDWRCGGSTYAHIRYEGQCRLKGEIIRDALARIGRIRLTSDPEVTASPERGYRMRARLHVQEGRLGFFREGSREVCDPALTGQLLLRTEQWIVAAERAMADARLSGLRHIEMVENMPGDERACHLELDAGADVSRVAPLAEGLTGLTAGRADDPNLHLVAGVPTVGDVLHVRPGDPTTAVRLRRDVRAFFQGNRYLLEPLVRHVAALVPQGPVVDLYAGVGLFGLSLAAQRGDAITLVEGDPVSGASLAANAEPFGNRVRVERRSVESFLANQNGLERAHSGAAGIVWRDSTIIVDPPRTGMSKVAVAGITRAGAARVVYVSCDVATFARDARTLVEAGYELGQLTGFDLFPNTAHVEAVGSFTHTD